MQTTEIIQPRLSVVVVAYDMIRELPRVIYSLSPQMQRGMDPASYEVIVVHNGPKGRTDDSEIRFPGLNIRILDVQNPTVSPAPAVNLGLANARGSLIGVMIDGARIASPGLLANALRASRLHERAVIATLGFHLGPDQQKRSSLKGYNQQVEDELLKSSDWESDGYRLFGISVFAGSCTRGWFKPISESNALFLTRALWDQLGGYDERFVTPAGGFVNLDAYKRACELEGSQLIVLLGEGTFHQYHRKPSAGGPPSSKAIYTREYEDLRKAKFSRPANIPWYFGEVGTEALPTIRQPIKRSPVAGHGIAAVIKSAVMPTLAGDFVRRLLGRPRAPKGGA